MHSSQPFSYTFYKINSSHKSNGRLIRNSAMYCAEQLIVFCSVKNKEVQRVKNAISIHFSVMKFNIDVKRRKIHTTLYMYIDTAEHYNQEPRKVKHTFAMHVSHCIALLPLHKKNALNRRIQVECGLIANSQLCKLLILLKLQGAYSYDVHSFFPISHMVSSIIFISGMQESLFMLTLKSKEEENKKATALLRAPSERLHMISIRRVIASPGRVKMSESSPNPSSLSHCIYF